MSFSNRHPTAHACTRKNPPTWNHGKNGKRQTAETGCAVGYCLVFPFTFRFLAEYQLSGSIVNQINLSSYIGIFLMMIFVMGLVFELPVLAWVLSKIGIVNRALLVRGRRYAVVGLLVLSAIITPSGDPFTLAVVFVPLYLLYELSVCVVRD